MTIPKKSLVKNKLLKDVKKTSDIRVYKELVKAKKYSPDALKKYVFEQKFLANSLILQVRIVEKTKMLSKKEQSDASHFIREIYNKMLSGGKMHNSKYFEFTKELTKAINRREGKEVFDILKVAFKKIKYIN
jgi:hypothetical protein